MIWRSPVFFLARVTGTKGRSLEQIGRELGAPGQETAQVY